MNERTLFRAGLVAIVFATMPAIAYADTKAAITLTAGGGASSNPYLLTGSSTGSGYVVAEAAPEVTVASERTTFSLRGNARLEQYFRLYGSDFSGNAAASIDQALSENTHTILSGYYSTSNGSPSGFVSGTIATTPDPLTIPTGDISTIGSRFRQHSFGGELKFLSQFSLHDKLDLSGRAREHLTRSTLANDYTQFEAEAGYARVLNERTDLGLRVIYAHTNYHATTLGDGNVITPQATIAYQVSDGFSLTGRAGASFASIVQSSGAKAKTTGFSGSLAACNKGPRSSSCLSASRSIDATSAGGISKVSSIDASQQWRLSERDSLSLRGSYARVNRTSATALASPLNRRKLLVASAEYERQLTERLYISINPSYEKTWDSLTVRKANYGAVATLSYRYGE